MFAEAAFQPIQVYGKIVLSKFATLPPAVRMYVTPLSVVVYILEILRCKKWQIPYIYLCYFFSSCKYLGHECEEKKNNPDTVGSAPEFLSHVFGGQINR